MASKENSTASPADAGMSNSNDVSCHPPPVLGGGLRSPDVSAALRTVVLYALDVPHRTPPACVESAVSTCASDPTPSRATVSAPVATSRSPLVVTVDAGILAARSVTNPATWDSAIVPTRTVGAVVGVSSMTIVAWAAATEVTVPAPAAGRWLAVRTPSDPSVATPLGIPSVDSGTYSGVVTPTVPRSATDRSRVPAVGMATTYGGGLRAQVICSYTMACKPTWPLVSMVFGAAILRAESTNVGGEDTTVKPAAGGS